MIAVITVFIILFSSLLVTRVATLIMISTGLSRETARFQTRSAMTGVGFTTTEAEDVIGHPVRRRVIMSLMLFGSAGIITVIAGFVITFSGSSGRQDVVRALVLAGGLAVALLIARLHWFDRRVTAIVSMCLERMMDIDRRDHADLVRLSNGYAVTELRIRPEDWVVNQTLGQTRLRDEGVVVLGVTREGTSDYLPAPIPGTQLRAGDTIVLYGASSRLRELDAREHGPAGDAAHRLAVEEHRATARALSVGDMTRPAAGPG
jgi:hypothetical protein